MRLVVMLFLAFLLACQEVESVEQGEYYNVDSLISAQYALLAESGPSISKIATIDGDTSSTEFTPDTTQWVTELSIFRRLELNKPKWKGRYTVVDSDDPFSNLRVRAFSIDHREAEVKYVKLYFLNNISQLRKLEARWVEKNPIYQSQRDMTLRFDDIKDQIVLSEYEISGSQKMMLRDEVNFNVKVLVNHP